MTLTQDEIVAIMRKQDGTCQGLDHHDNDTPLSKLRCAVCGHIIVLCEQCDGLRSVRRRMRRHLQRMHHGMSTKRPTNTSLSPPAPKMPH